MSPHVMHGFTMADLEDISRLTVLNNRHRLATWNLSEAIETAWQGAAEYLCAAEEKPERKELHYAAWEAVRKDVRSAQRDRVTEERGARVQQFWNQAGVTHSHDENVTERVAFRQVWQELTDVERQTFICNALCDYNLPRTADMLGVTKRAAEGRLFRARRHFYALWHEHETPRPMSAKAVRRPKAGFAAA